MANIRISRTSPNGRKVLNANEMFKTAVAQFHALDGARLQAIGVSQAEMKDLFGVDTEANAQALSDLWGAFINEMNTNLVIKDFMDRVFEGEALV